MKNLNAKSKQRSQTLGSPRRWAQAAWLALLFWALAPALWAQVPGIPTLTPTSVPARCGTGQVTFTVNAPGTVLNDEVVLIPKALYPNYPTAPVTAAWSYNFSSVNCNLIYNTPGTNVTSPNQWGACAVGSFPDPTVAGSSAKQAFRLETGVSNFSFQFHNASNAINGTGIELEGTPTTGTLLSKYIIRGFQGGTRFYARVVIMPTTNATGNVWRIAFGKSGLPGNNFNETASTINLTDIFAGVNIIFSSTPSNWSFQNLVSPNISSPPTFNYNTPLTLEFIGNNTSEEIYYNYNGQMHALDSFSFNIWANGQKLYNTNTPNFVGALGPNVPIDAFSLSNSGAVSTAGEGQILLGEVAFNPSIPHAIKEAGATINGTAAPLFEITTPTLTTNTSYWVAAIDKAPVSPPATGTWQMSPTALDQTITVHPPITASPTAPATVTRCGPGLITFTMSGISGSANAFAVWDNATSIAAANFVTPATVGATSVSGGTYTLTASNLTATTTYYLEAIRSISPFANNQAPNHTGTTPHISGLVWGCTSAVRTPVVLTVYTAPSVTLSASPAHVCNSGSVTLTFTSSPAPGQLAQLRLFADPTTPTSLAQSIYVNFTTYSVSLPSVNTTTTYYGQLFSNVTDYQGNTCPITMPPRTMVTVTVLPTPGAPSVVNMPNNNSQCGTSPATFTVTMGATAGDAIGYYTVDAAVPATTTDVSSPYTFQNGINSFPALNFGTNTYYFKAFWQALPGCSSATTTYQYHAREIPALPSAAAPPVICGVGSTTITAMMGFPAGNQILLYGSPGGPDLLAQATASPYTLNTPTLSNTTSSPNTVTYHLEAVNAGTGGQVSCTSATRTAVAVTVNPQLSAPTAAVVSAPCGPGIVTLSGSTGNSFSVDIRLYTAAQGGFPQQIASNVSGSYNLTFFNSTTTTYYVAAFAGGCEGPRAMVAVNASATPPTPPTAPAISVCTNNASQTVTFTVSASGSISQAKLYADALGSIPVSQTSTPLTASPLTFALPTTGQTFSLGVPKTFYMQLVGTNGCVSSLVPVTATLNPIPSSPTTEFSNATRCGAGVVAFTTTATLPPSNATGYRLYTQSVGGNPIATDNSAPFELSTPSLAVNTTVSYYIEAFNQGTGCVSPSRLAVTASVFEVPALPIINNISFCGSTPVTFTVTPATTGPMVVASSTKIWDAASGGNDLTSQFSIGSGSPSFTLSTNAPINTTRSYFVSVVSQNNCASPRRQVTATQSSLPAMPNGQVSNRCGVGDLTFTVSGGPANPEFRLYDNNNMMVGSVQPPSNTITFSNAPIGSHTFFLEVSNTTAPGCTSARRSLSVTVFDFPSPPSAADVARCGSGSVAITASMGSVAGNQIRIYNAAMGGNVLATASAMPYILSVSAQSTTTYYIEAFNTANGCSSSMRAPVIVTINAQPGLPDLVSVASPNTCGSYTPTLRVRMNQNAPGDQVRVYNQSTGGNLVASCTACSTGVESDGLTYYYITLPSPISTNTNYFVSAVNSVGNCESTQRRQVQATISAVPAEPIVSSTIRVCASSGAGISQLTFTSQMGNPGGNEMRLYENQNDPAPIFTSTFAPYQMQINNLAVGSYTYYLEARNSVTGCVGARRPVNIEVLAKPEAPSNSGGNSYSAIAERCGAGQISFTIAYGNNTNIAARLYRNMNDINYIDEDRFPEFGNTFAVFANVTGSTTFYISMINTSTGCESERVEVKGNTASVPLAPQVANVSRCGSGPLTFSATISTFESGSYMRLYDAQTGGSLLAENFNPSISANNPNQFVFTLSPGLNYGETTDFWVSYERSNGCGSPRVRVRGIVSPIPGAPVASNVSRCGSGVVTLTAQMGVPSGDKIRVYTQLGALATPIDSAAAPYRISLEQSASNTLYIASVLGDCESERVPVSVTINDNTGTVSVNDVTRCGFGSATFTAIPSLSGVTAVRLYTQAQGGTAIAAAGSPFLLNTPPISVTTTFYISAYNGSADCEASIRVPAVVTVTPGPEAPVLTSEELTSCGPMSVTLSALGLPTGANQLRLYNQPFGGNPLSTVSFPPFRFNVGTVATSTMYYVASANGSCESVRVPVSVLIYELPSLPNSANVTRCGPGLVTFTAQMGAVAGTEIRLFDNDDQLIEVDANPPYQLSASVSAASTSFQLRVFDSATGCFSGPRAVTASVSPLPGPVLAAMPSYGRCGSGVLTLTLFSQFPQGNVIRLYSVAQGGQELANSTNLSRITTPFTTQSVTYYLEQANTVTGCVSSSRTSVEININPMVSAPLVSSSTRTIGCGAGNFTTISAQMGTVAGDVMYLYKQATGGFPIDQATSAPYVLNTDAVASQTTYYVAAFNSQTGCESERVAVVVTVSNLPPSQPVVSSVTLCSAQPTAPIFTANMGNLAGSEIRLYTQASGGSPVATAFDAPYILVAPTPITTNTTYFVTAATGNCESARRPVAAIVGSLPGTPSVQDVFRCPAGVVTFTVTPGAGPAPVSVRMYTSPMASVAVMVDNSAPFTFMVNPGVNTTYYFAAVNGACETERVAASAIFDAPLAIASSVSRCGSGNVFFTVTAQPGSSPISEVRLFDASGQLLRASDNTAPFELGAFVTTTTSFIIRAYGSNSACVSSDLAVTATVGGDLAPPTAIGGNTVSQCGSAPATIPLSLPLGAGVSVYDAPSGGNLIASLPAGASSVQLPAGTYFLASVSSLCESAVRSQVNVIGITVPARPLASNVSFCGNVPVMFTARMGAPAGDRMLLYTLPTGGQSIASASIPDGQGNYMLSTPSAVTSNATYYIAAANQGCESSRLEVIATQNATLAPPSVSSPINLCGAGEATINVNVGNAQVELVRLYTSLTGGSPIRTATAPFVLQTPVVSAPGATFFVESVAGSCVSTRTAVFISVGAGSAVSAPFGGATSRCGAGPVTIVANLGSGGGSEIRLYNAPTGGSILASDNSSPFELTANVTTTTTFYLAALGSDGCESQRAPVLVTVNPTPSEPFAANVTRCNAGNASISATQGAVPGDEIRLYTQPSGGFPLVSSNNPPYILNVSVSATTDFFIAAANAGGCESSRRRVTVEVTGGPSVTVNSSAATCGQGGSVTAFAAGGSGSYTYNLGGATSSVGTFSGLAPGNYVLTVRDNSTQCVATQSVTVGAPAGPSSVTVTNISGGTATVNWTSVAGAQSYRVRFGTGGNFSEITVPASQLSAVIQTVPNSAYDVQVFAICASNINTTATGTNFTSGGQVSQNCGLQRQGVCVTPANIQVTNVTANSANITWVPNEDGQGSAVCYAVRYGIAGTNPSNWPQFLVPHPGCFLQASNLLPGQTYEVQIRTNCSNCSFQSGLLTPYSTPVSFNTPVSRLAEAGEALGLNLKVYPNPSTGLFTVSFNAVETGQAHLTLTDVTGRVAHKQIVKVESGENQVAVDLSGNPQGVYLLQLRQGEAKSVIRVILN
jgi:hypothetical protein